MRIVKITVLLVVAAAFAFGQQTTPPLEASVFAGQASALMFAFGDPNSGVPSLTIGIGNAATGSQTITLDFGTATTHDGVPFYPISTSGSLLVGGPGNQETVTPSAVSCTTPSAYQTCQFTATFSNTHFRGEQVRSGTFGLAEAINWFTTSAAGPNSAGNVILSRNWRNAGGTTAMITGITSATMPVWVIDSSKYGGQIWYGKSDRTTGAYSATNNDRSFQLTLSGGTATKTLANAYTVAPQCVANYVSGTGTGIIKVTSNINTVTVTSSAGGDNAVVNVACQLAD